MTKALVTLSSGAVVSVSNIEAQMELCKRFKFPTTFVERNMFVPNGTRPDGEPLYKIVKRDKPVRIFDDGHALSVAATEKTYAARIGLDKMRGKYNDEARLFGQDAGSIEWKETLPFATI